MNDDPNIVALREPIMDPKDEYQRLLSDYRVTRSAETISNCFPWQSRLAVLELLRFAKDEQKEIRILSGSATDQFYRAEVISQLKECLSIGCTVRLVVWNALSLCDALQSLLRDFPGRFDVQFSGTRRDGDALSHFLLVGNSAYRLEAPHRFLDRLQFSDTSPEVKAKICFNDEASGKSMASLFEGIWTLLRLRKSSAAKVEIAGEQMFKAADRVGEQQ